MDAAHPALAGLAPLGVWQRLERSIAGLPPYGALCVLAAAKIAGMAVVLRLHAIAKPKLMSIGWYRRIHDGVLGWRRRIYLSQMAGGRLRQTVRRSKKYMHDLRARIVELRACLARYAR